MKARFPALPGLGFHLNRALALSARGLGEGAVAAQDTLQRSEGT
jgi:hypothetical protein